MTFKAMLLAALLAAPVAAQEQGPVRVERRVLVKEKHTFVSAGALYLARGDYFTSPGVEATVAFYPLEQGGLELRGAWFASSLTGSADEVFRISGLRPDGYQPQGLLDLRWRQGLAYGKLAAGATVLHFDLQAVGGPGLLFTDRGAVPALSLGGALLLRITKRFYTQLELGLLGSVEPRTGATLSLGFLPVLAAGVSL